jgi:sarcosine oxidase subunit gamma
MTAIDPRWEAPLPAVHAAHGTAGMTGPARGPGSALLFDLSLRGRSGIKGAGALELAAEAGFVVPEKPNLATRQADGGLCLRLGMTELLMLDGETTSGGSAKLDAVWQAARAAGRSRIGWLLPRQDSHAWLRLCGSDVVGVLSRISAIDFSPRVFADLEISQTSVARTTAIVLRNDGADGLSFELLCDRSLAPSLWESLIAVAGGQAQAARWQG